MQDSHWAIKLEKSANGKMALKFWGCFNLSLKHVAYIISLMVALGSLLSFATRYFA